MRGGAQPGVWSLGLSESVQGKLRGAGFRSIQDLKGLGPIDLATGEWSRETELGGLSLVVAGVLQRPTLPMMRR